MYRSPFAFVAALALLPACGRVFAGDASTRYAREHYEKREVRIPMRDGTELFTAIYAPKDRSRRYPILLSRTPYGAGPYGASKFRDVIGPSDDAMRDGFVVVYQDVRGCYLSGGEFENVRPILPTHATPQEVDESTDAWDTIDWLLANVPSNGKVGMWGISYPGFFAASGMIDHHPALLAVSPQAPIADWFFDDFHRHGTVVVPHAVNFLAGFGQPRPEPVKTRPWGYDFPTADGYEWFLRLGPLSNLDDRVFHGRIPFWNAFASHPNRDAFWEARDLAPRLKNVAPAVMTVGGWFDAEDLYGALHVYRAIEDQNPGAFNVLVMGPWYHGGWSESDGESLGDVRFGSKTSLEFRQRMELAFFDRFLKDEPAPEFPEATMFETGTNRWRTFDHWPPRATVQRSLFVREGHTLSFDPPTSTALDAGDVLESDPANPVPYTRAKSSKMTREFMVEDQRFVEDRPDVLTFRTPVLDGDLTIAGPILAELWVSTTGTDADWIVKVIDVQPENGEERLVRAEAIRGRFRESCAKPKPFVPGEPTLVPLELEDVLHTFAKGHRVMVQIQSTWFPLIDRNPQTYVENVFRAQEADFRKATERVYRSAEHPSLLRIGVLPNGS